MGQVAFLGQLFSWDVSILPSSGTVGVLALGGWGEPFLSLKMVEALRECPHSECQVFSADSQNGDIVFAA